MATKSIHIISSIILCLGMIFPLQLISSSETKIKSFPFKIVNSLIIIEAEIDGKEGNYILDTGTDAILLDGSPDQTNQNIITPSGDLSTHNTKLTSLKVGNYVKYDVDAHIVSLSSLKDELGIDLSGIIGGKFFMPENLILDFKHSEVIISSHITSTDVAGMNTESFTLVNQIPIINIKIQNKSYRFALDSGATAHFVCPSTLQRIEAKTTVASHTDIWTVQNVSEIDVSFVIESFSLGNVKFSGHHYISYDLDHINTELDTPIDGIISLAEIAHEKIILDFRTQKLYF